MASSNTAWKDFLDYAVQTDVGMRRANNQDAHAELLAPDAEHWMARGHVFMVADGMGAHAAGELASKLATDHVPHTYYKLRDHSPPEAICQSILEINSHIHRRGQASPDFHGMGTTASVLLLLPQGALVAHVGDSRVYRLRGNLLEQLTFDHSLVWEVTASGQLPKESIPKFVPKNIITRSLGPHDKVQVDVEGPFPLEVGDTFLLCSDGLSGQITDEEIGSILFCFPPSEAVPLLVDFTNLRGGPDNVTVIVVRVKHPAMCEAASQAEPLMLPSDDPTAPRTRKGSNPVYWWVAGALAIVLAVALGAFELFIPAGISLLVAVVLVIAGSILRIPTARKSDYLAPGAKLGRGPHTSTPGLPSATLPQTLAHYVEQLRGAAAQGDWILDQAAFQQHVSAARSAHSKGDSVQATREFGTALRLIMDEFRHQRTKNKKQEDSAMEGLT